MKPYEQIPEEAERAAEAVVGAAFSVHKALGPGLLESVYEVCLCHELSKRGIAFQSQFVGQAPRA
jgi:GxxExxY protein